MGKKNKVKNILFDKITGHTSGGADYSLFYIIKGLDRKKYNPVVLYSNICPIILKLQSKGIKTVFHNDYRFTITDIEQNHSANINILIKGFNKIRRISKKYYNNIVIITEA